MKMNCQPNLLVITSLFLILCMNPSGGFSQFLDPVNTDSVLNERGEVYFTFEIKDREEIGFLTKIISLDHVNNATVFAYANKDEFASFLRLNIPYRILPAPGLSLSKEELDYRSTGKMDNETTIWNYYPNYNEYLTLMTGFATAHPDLCQLDTVGTSVQNRLILCLKISDNVEQTEAEPQFLYTSSIHGDELTGYVLMLHFIDYLLINYGTDPAITELVNNTEIFINPLANPDGTFNGGNNSVYGAIRFNANYIDLNRNFPDPKVGQHPDGNAWQKETVAWMDYASQHHFSLSANFHGGAEVFNYPWDTWSKFTADDDWWQFVGREWADTVHQYAPAGYFTYMNNGISNGNAWYEINGGRQDYMNYWHHCREVTVEISDIKLLPTSQLLNHWEYNYRTFLNFMRQAQYGINGIVSDTVTDEPVEAKVLIHNHDKDNSEVYSHLPTGFYSRPIFEGTYNLTFSAPGYYTKTVTNVEVTNWETTPLDVQLRPLTFDAQDKTTRKTMIFPNPSDGHFKLVFPEHPVNPSCAIQLLNEMGVVVYSDDLSCEKGCTQISISLPSLAPGVYFLKFNTGYRIYFDKLILRN